VNDTGDSSDGAAAMMDGCPDLGVAIGALRSTVAESYGSGGDD
jgi:hypothetical protein